jgi:hypothetical protein
VKLRPIAGLAAGLALVAAPAGAQSAPTVQVRVEGQHATLLEDTAVTLGSDPVPGNGCPGISAAGALEDATHGNWDRQPFTHTILGETHNGSPDYWAEWIRRGGRYVFGNGLCNDVMQAGDELLMLVDFASPPTFLPTVLPLAIEGLPASAPAASAATVTVVDYRPDFVNNTTVREPVAGATVGGATTDAAGHATIRFAAPGDEVFKATKAGDAPSSAEHVTVTAAGGAPPPVVAPPDRTAPVARLLGLRDHESFRARRAPRTLRVAVPADPSGVKGVSLRLTRQLHGRWWYFSGARGRFVRSRFGRRVPFSVPVQPRISYLLPHRLGRGRYVLDVIATDGAGNREPLARGTSRVVFFVR